MEKMKVKYNDGSNTAIVLHHIATISKWKNGTYELNMLLWDKPIFHTRITYDLRFFDNEGNPKECVKQFTRHELEALAKAYDFVESLYLDIEYDI